MNILVSMRNAPEYPRVEVSRMIKECSAVEVSTEQDADAIITWNNYGFRGQQADRIKVRGGLHIVMENGQLAREKGYFLFERDGFNGRGTWHPTGSAKKYYREMGLGVKRWRGNNEGDHILVCGQRGGSYSDMAMPNDWPARIMADLRRITDRPIWFRPHWGRPDRVPAELPTNSKIVPASEPLEEQLRNAYRVMVWTSSAATAALRSGVLAFYCGPTIEAHRFTCPWGSSSKGCMEFDMPLHTRRRFLVDYAHRHFTREQIASGLPLRNLLGDISK